MGSNGDTLDRAHDSEDDDDAPTPPAEDASLAELIRYTRWAASHGIRAHRETRLQIETGFKDVLKRLKALGDEMSEQRGVLARVEVLSMRTTAKLAHHLVESEPPSIEKMQEMRAAVDKAAKELRAADEKQTRRIDRIEVERRVRGAKTDATLDDLKRRVGDVEGDVKDTTKRAIVTAEHANEVLRESQHELIVENRGRVEAKEEKAAEANVHVVVAREGRRFRLIEIVAVPLVLLAVGLAGAKLQTCGVPIAPIHIPAPAAAPPH